MAQLAYKATISIVSLDSAKATGERFDVVPGMENTFRVKKRKFQNIDPTKPVVAVPDNLGDGVSIEVVDGPSGIVRFVSSGQDLPDFGPTRNFTFSYFTETEILGANSFSVDFTGDILPNTDFKTARENGGYMTKQYGMNDVSITLSKFFDITPTAKKLRQMRERRERVVIEILPSQGLETIRGVFLSESINLSGDMSALEMEEYTFQLAGDMATTFSWSDYNAT